VGYYGDDWLGLWIMADGFLWHQIRCIMEVLVAIGRGKVKLGVMDELLEG